MSEIEEVAVLGTGVIGSSWTALFLSAGLRVHVHDPAPESERCLKDYVEACWPTLEALGMTKHGSPDALHVHASAGLAVENAQFIQECVPERLELKFSLFRDIEARLGQDAVVASSASGLMLSEMQRGWQNPSRFLLGHPFNPPHLIPLVELLVNSKTAEGVLEIAEQFYERVGKITIRVNKEVPAHVANRLQAALWREAISLVENGVASVEDVDKAVWAGPGLRWAAMGPHMLFHLGAGPGGLNEFCKRYADSFRRWWDDLGEVELTEDLAKMLYDGVAREARGDTTQELSQRRDALIVGYLQSRKRCDPID
ncbi:MAG: 3-hydroxyacyl-CoA dehydrogenase NAD-binding domain-containing protein [Gammaproteobacteria bacterium]|nr:3-hydroxyacyl-CoA dehydrogenase NAD-binding domain-containing protein [Gammaproteobacteria bacterium]MCY4229214.1 3-hydroxyacyl-CoA dehydrogenase NAD-binding domain-containing protein [Gammaproteobacteria bacterium]